MQEPQPVDAFRRRSLELEGRSHKQGDPIHHGLALVVEIDHHATPGRRAAELDREGGKVSAEAVEIDVQVVLSLSEHLSLEMHGLSDDSARR